MWIIVDKRQGKDRIGAGVGGTYTERECENERETFYRSIIHMCVGGTAVAQLLRCCATNREVAGFDPSWCHWNFSLT